MYEKAKFVCFNYIQPQKVKLISVQINMKQVLYHLDNTISEHIAVFQKGKELTYVVYACSNLSLSKEHIGSKGESV